MTDGTTAAGYTNPDLLETGPLPRNTGFARWGRWAEPDPLAVESLGPPLTYSCMRSSGPLTLDPTLSHPDWVAATWSAPFTRIEDGGPVALSTRVALLWDDHALYAGFRLEDPDVRAVRTGFNDHVYVEDEDIELFIDLGPIYYELGLNAINQGYQIRWVWLDEILAAVRSRCSTNCSCGQPALLRPPAARHTGPARRPRLSTRRVAVRRPRRRHGERTRRYTTSVGRRWSSCPGPRSTPWRSRAEARRCRRSRAMPSA